MKKTCTPLHAKLEIGILLIVHLSICTKPGLIKQYISWIILELFGRKKFQCLACGHNIHARLYSWRSQFCWMAKKAFRCHTKIKIEILDCFLVSAKEDSVVRKIRKKLLQFLSWDQDWNLKHLQKIEVKRSVQDSDFWLFMGYKKVPKMSSDFYCYFDSHIFVLLEYFTRILNYLNVFSHKVLDTWK